MYYLDVAGLNKRDVVATAQRKVNAALLDYCAAFSSRRPQIETHASQHTHCEALASLDIDDMPENGTDKFGDLLIQVASFSE